MVDLDLGTSVWRRARSRSTCACLKDCGLVTSARRAGLDVVAATTVDSVMDWLAAAENLLALDRRRSCVL